MRKVFICFSECFSAQEWLGTKTTEQQGQQRGGGQGGGHSTEWCVSIHTSLPPSPSSLLALCVKMLQLLMGLLVVEIIVAASSGTTPSPASLSPCPFSLPCSQARNVEQRLCNRMQWQCNIDPSSTKRTTASPAPLPPRNLSKRTARGVCAICNFH